MHANRTPNGLRDCREGTTQRARHHDGTTESVVDTRDYYSQIRGGPSKHCRCSQKVADSIDDLRWTHVNKDRVKVEEI